MSSVGLRMRQQTAVYWERQSADSYGRYSYAEPIELPCRWEQKVEEFRDSKGEKLVSKATVYLDRVVKQGDIMRQGTLDLDAPADPRSLTDVFEVRIFEQVPDIKAEETLHIARLK